MRYQGRIESWDDGKGFGFVTPNGGGDKAFVHIKAFLGGQRRPVDGDLITYKVKLDQQRRLQATEIRFPAIRKKQPPPSRKHPPAVLFCVAFCIVVALATSTGKIPLLIPSIYAAMSIVTFIAYAIDKHAAQRNRWRTPEKTLHLLGLVGGWPGALVAQRMLHHKSSKEAFQTVYRVTVLVNCSAFLWLFSESGSAFIRAIPSLY